MSGYIYDERDWPNLRWDAERVSHELASVRYEQGRLIGWVQSLGFDLRQEAVLEMVTDDVLKSTSIEGQTLDPAQVRSSIARHLGMDVGGLVPADRYAEGAVEMMLDATRNYGSPLTVERLFGWQASLFPGGRSGMRRIVVGAWRDDKTGPMQVVSGPVGRQRVHFEAPAAERIPDEMRAFLEWFEKGAEADWVLRAAVAHLWFVTLHPFDDGNGRIARAIADMALARSEQSAQRFYSMSAQIRQERKAYYEVLEQTQKGGLDITTWIDWFLGCLMRALEGAHGTLAGVLAKARFWQAAGSGSLNDRQRDVLNRLLDGGFEGKLTTSKWAKLAKCSHATAWRDISALVEQGLLRPTSAGGRSTAYELVMPDTQDE